MMEMDNREGNASPGSAREQIEMRRLADEMAVAISTEVEHRYLADEMKLEAVLKENGWRKASDVAREIIDDFDNHGVYSKDYTDFLRREYGVNKKENTEDTK